MEANQILQGLNFFAILLPCQLCNVGAALLVYEERLTFCRVSHYFRGKIVSRVPPPWPEPAEAMARRAQGCR
jgi:hypothetical protein